MRVLRKVLAVFLAGLTMLGVAPFALAVSPFDPLVSAVTFTDFGHYGSEHFWWGGSTAARVQVVFQQGGDGPAHHRRFVDTRPVRWVIKIARSTPRAARNDDGASQHRNRDDPTRLRRLDRSWLWTVFLQRQVGAVPMIILQESLQVAVQAALVEDDEMIQAFAANRTDQPLDIRSLPR